MKSLIIMLAMNATILNNRVDELRLLLNQAYKNEQACQLLDSETAQYKNTDAALLIGYKGMAAFMQCKYVFSPFEKLSYFNKGKKLLEAALKQDPQNVELHYLRLTVQINTPIFLGYKADIEKDKTFVLAHLCEKNNKIAYQHIKEYMLKADCCSMNEKHFLSTLE